MCCCYSLLFCDFYFILLYGRSGRTKRKQAKKNRSRAVARKPRDAACFSYAPMTPRLLFASTYERSMPS